MTRRIPLLVLGISLGIGVGLLGMELVLRVARDALFSAPRVGASIERYPITYDPLLGYTPTPRAQRRWHSGDALTITSEGIRSNGRFFPPSGEAILAVGDSFTFGDEVGDGDTWPAHLERILERPVINGGVFGYGFDQIVLRAEQLLETFSAAVLVVSLIPDDVARCEYSYRYAWKPYFEIEDGTLVLQNVPAPPPEARAPRSPLGRLARSSHLAEVLLRNLDPVAWQLGGVKRAHHDGAEVAALLVERIARLGAERGVAVLLMLQWQPSLAHTDARPALARAEQLGMAVLDVEPFLREVIGNDEARLRRFYTARIGARRFVANHMNGAGNRFIAERVVDKLIEMGVAENPAAPRLDRSPVAPLTPRASRRNRAATG